MENSNIEWTDHTFNPWHGCMKVSEGCKNCYAETLDNRWNGGHWGPGSTRKPMSESYWQKPLKWDKEAGQAGTKAKVFCASMADVFEDHPEVIEWRKRLFRIIDSTPNLIWQLLTKRPENILKMAPDYWGKEFWPDNLWIGTSVENQAAADERIPYIQQIPVRVRFLSCEPLLGPVNLNVSYELPHPSPFIHSQLASCLSHGPTSPTSIQWVICGGESGGKARPMNPEWAIAIRNQCRDYGVPFFFKQWGEWGPYVHGEYNGQQLGAFCTCGQFRHGNIVDHRYPGGIGVTYMAKLGKKAAGSLVDGEEHKNFPLIKTQ